MNQQDEKPDVKSALGGQFTKTHERLARRRRRIIGVITLIVVVIMLVWILGSLAYWGTGISNAAIFWKIFFPTSVFAEVGIIMDTLIRDDEKKAKIIAYQTLVLTALDCVFAIIINIIW